MKENDVISVPVQGCCGGVRRAIAMALDLRRQRPNEPIAILGSLVHNAYVIEALRRKNITTIDAKGKTRLELLDEVEEGLLLFTAHGVSSKVREKAKAKGLEVFDATCPFVLSTQKLIRKKLEEGFDIFYIGKLGHPESESVYSESENVHLIETADDIPRGLTSPIFVTNQTTMSVLDVKDIFEAIKELYPHAQIEDEICNATRVRQEAVLDLKDQNIDMLVVLGDPHSNNTRQLAAVGKLAGIPEICQIESPAQLPDFPLGKRIALTSGASTPVALLEKTEEKLRHPERTIELNWVEIL
jgi:4-hydroxy-3-methylbut-2-enyl diphosphate reductase